MTKDEQETIVTVSRTDDLVSIYTSDMRYIRKLFNDERFTITREHCIAPGEIVAVDATIPQSAYNALTGVKRRSKPMTPEQREKAVERLQRIREGREVMRSLR